MISMVKRNLQLYFQHKPTVFFSLMGAWISFALYLIFLKKNMLDAWSSASQPDILLDRWIMGGTLAAASLTTVWTGATRLVYDRESHKLEDFLLTDQSYFRLILAYLISSSLIGLVMQVATYGLMQLYFFWSDGLSPVWDRLPGLMGLMILGSLFSACICMILVTFIRKIEVADRISVLIGAAIGFLVGVYMPIGALPDGAQTIIKCTPWAYLASSYRHILLQAQTISWQRVDVSPREFLGIGIKLDHLTSLKEEVLLIGLATVVSFLLLLALLALRKEKEA